MCRKLFVGLVLLLGVAWWEAQAARAQQATGGILGTVTDGLGTPISRASVAVEELATHVMHKTVTSKKGRYVVSLLVPGQYSVKITAIGFQTFTIPSITLAAGDRPRFNVCMAVQRQQDDRNQAFEQPLTEKGILQKLRVVHG